MGFVDPPKNGSVETTTPPETRVGPEGTLPERWLPVTSMPLAPRSAIPIPEKFLVELRGSTRARIVLDRVGFHLEVTYGFARVSFEEHASAVVVDRVSGDGASFSVGDVHAKRAARDVVANNLRVRGLRACQKIPTIT